MQKAVVEENENGDGMELLEHKFLGKNLVV
jgi:hypothetical protein